MPVILTLVPKEILGGEINTTNVQTSQENEYMILTLLRKLRSG